MSKRQLRISYSSEHGAKVVELVKDNFETADEVERHITAAVSKIVKRAFDDDAEAQGQLLKLHQICYPHFYQLTGPIRHVMAVRFRMAELSSVVMPTRGNNFLPAKNASGAWPLVKLRETPVVEKIDGSQIILADDASFFSSEIYLRAVHHFRNRKSKNFTLQSLALHDYIETLELGETYLKKNWFFKLMRQTREHEQEHPPNLFIELVSGELLPYYPFADSLIRKHA
jgi:hypothetical protein